MQQIAAQPAGFAVITRNETLTYGEFGRLVRRLARALAEFGQHPRVLIHLPQGAYAYAAMFATLLAGGYYSPMNLDAPPARQKLIRGQFGADVTVTIAALVGELDGPAEKLVIADDLSTAELASQRPSHDLAYVIFTSGSTGTPKGVMIGRSSLAHYLDWAIPALALGPGDRVSQHPNIGFDLSVLDIYASFCSGAALIPLTDAKDRLLPAEAVRQFKITVWVSVPSVIDLMRRAHQMNADHLESLRLFVFCGEPLLPAHLEAIFGALPKTSVLNTYGPTEATVSCTALTLTAGNYRAACDTTAAFGDAIRGMQLHLVGGENSSEGEIVLAGPQVARGYWNDPDRTEHSFRLLPDRSAIGYYTGDWGERRNEHIFFCNRMDRQVKVHGYRFELGEVDAALRKAGALASFTVLAGQSIISFVEEPADPRAMHAELLKHLPGYGMPKEIRVIAQLPRNNNDKIDGQELTRRAEEA
ncbi:MAG: AMP-binding protein [Proteobacteria bacterium]|nr:AMP-binding protein [Pseudomonadota bacterium]